MPKRKNKDQDDQLSLFQSFNNSELEDNLENNTDDLDENLDDNYDWLEEEEDLSASQRTIDNSERELLTLKLLKDAIQKENPDDPVMADLAEYVLPNLLKITIGVTAKGGQFFDNLDRQRVAEGKEKVRRNNATDQSLNTHLLNGLFPASAVQKYLSASKFDTTAKRLIKEKQRRILIAGFILHDFEKFPDMKKDCRDQPVEKHREIIQKKCEELGLNYLINPADPLAYQEYIDDLLCIAYNAQKRWGTNWNFSEHGLNPVMGDRLLGCLSDFSCLADSLSSIIKHPQDAENMRINELIHALSDGKLKLTYHSIAENRGVLTNILNNALIDAHVSLNTVDNEYYKPLLYLPAGVIYLARRDAPPVKLDQELCDRVVKKIKSLCAHQLENRQTGFGRDGKGMKYAEYYNLFFDTIELMSIGLGATLKILKEGKPSVAKSRSDNLIKFQKQGILTDQHNFEFTDDIRIDQIAEFGDLVSRKIWAEQVDKINQYRKQNTKLPALPELDFVEEITKFWQLTEYLPAIREIQRINESLKANNMKGNTGGVPYQWYYLAAQYIKKNPGLESAQIKEKCQRAIAHISKIIQPILEQYNLPDGWDDLRLWVQRVVMLPHTEINASHQEVFLQELNNYQLAKKIGRGKQLICSISHSAYSVTEQMESAVLFTPQVYTNKQMLGGSNAKRNISSIAGMEMMLRQILMNQTQAVGKKFEDGKYRYLYFYPTYYFTPETNKFLQMAYTNISQTRFDTTLRNHFISKDMQANFDKINYQTADSFLITENLATDKDHTFKLSYPEEQPLTFYFMALPPGRDPTDVESWVMPTWLALTFPLILDVKTVVSESPIPPFIDGSEFEQTVFLDSIHQALKVLLNNDYFRLDHILEGWQDEANKQFSSPLNTLTASYAIHLEVNAKQGKSGYNPNWGKFTELATDLQTSPLYVFTYLNKWVRHQKNIETARIEKIKLYTYDFYPCFDAHVLYNQFQEQLDIMSSESPLNHPQNLTRLYRKFYLANKRFNPKANAILKPIDVATNVILNADRCLAGDLVSIVAAEICKLMDRVHSSTAEGRWVYSNREEERQAVLEFAEYFVVEVFEKSFAGDRARLAGRQINLIKDTCEFLYRLENDKDNKKEQENKKLGEKPSKDETDNNED
jgi:CRISPR-associated protein Csc3